MCLCVVAVFLFIAAASKLYKLNSIMDKGLDKVLDELTKKEKSN